MSRGLKREAAASNKYESAELRIGAKLWMVPTGAGLSIETLMEVTGSPAIGWHMLI